MEKVYIAGAADTIAIALMLIVLLVMFIRWAFPQNIAAKSSALVISNTECNHDHAGWRLDLTKEIFQFKQMRKGPSDYSHWRNVFIRAFELNDNTTMETANDEMKRIEQSAGVINDVDIIERLMQIKKIPANIKKYAH